MGNILARLTQASSYAGFGLLFQGITMIAADVSSVDGWALAFSGAAAILKNDSVK